MVLMIKIVPCTVYYIIADENRLILDRYYFELTNINKQKNIRNLKTLKIKKSDVQNSYF